LTTNLALPGFGTLIAGRVVGYAQAVICLIGLLVTTLFGIHFLIWALSNWSDITGASSDPAQTLIDIYLNVRWAVLGMLLFGFSWIWALISSVDIVMDSRRRAKQKSPPPVLDPKLQ
jgi:hypothetical protein